MEQNIRELLDILLAPIQNAPPGGEDLAYSSLYEQIREARRADDPSLAQAQGDWATKLKVADWSIVRTVCQGALSKRSKDMQLALWYVEALTRQNGFAGASFGFRLMAGLLEEYWEHLFPRDPDERVGKLEWLNSQYAPVLRQVPLTSPEHGGYDWFHWQESRDVENLYRRGEEPYERAVSEGRLTPEAFDKSARASGQEWYQKLVASLAETRSSLKELNLVVQKRFGTDAPSLRSVDEAINACHEVAQRMFESCGGAEAPASKNSSANSEQGSAASTMMPRRASGGGIANRTEAIDGLREVARFFRENEPHSPVALLAECAAKWAEMPVENLLQTVIKNEGLHEMLGISAK